jgi:predicted DNA-binding ribbon-helix-helix protein
MYVALPMPGPIAPIAAARFGAVMPCVEWNFCPATALIQMEAIGEGRMRDDPATPWVRRTVEVGGRKTSVSLEEPFWTALKDVAGAQGFTRSQLVDLIADHRPGGRNLSSAVRVYVLDRYRTLAEHDARDIPAIGVASSVP